MMNTRVRKRLRCEPSIRFSPTWRSAFSVGLAFVGVGLFSVHAAAQCTSLDYAPTARVAGTNVADIVSADIDRDGDLDVLTADASAAGIHIFVNNGALGFAQHTITSGAPPRALAFADVDSDGDPDLLVGSSNGMSWLRNDGSGTFTIAATYSFPVGDSNPIAIVMADVDEDGHLDAILGLNIHASSAGTTGGLWIALGDGAGNFQPLATQSLPLRTVKIAVADFDGDGHLDVAELGGYPSASAVSVATGLGDGSFVNGSPSFAVGIYSNGLVVGDFDGDGDVDLATGFKYYLSIRFNDGSGHFSLAQSVDVGSYVKGIAAGDLDGDGDLDLLATSGGASAIRLVTNDSTGHFNATANIPASIQCYSVMLADTNGDGYLDPWGGDVTTGQLFSGESHCNSTCGGSANYCTAAPNSTGLGAVISHTGSRSIAANTFALACSHLPPNSTGVFFFGDAQTSTPFGNGFRCVAGAVVRLTPYATANGAGDVASAIDFSAAPVAGAIQPGSTKYFQYWYRNPAAGGAGFNLSDGLSVTFCN